MHEIGVMQGRLVPQVDGRIQAFPRERWREEFQVASTLGFHSIEFVFESDRYDENPLYSDRGLTEILRLIDASGVGVSAVCADYFMDRPFFRVDESDRVNSIAVLKRLISSAARLGARLVEIPCVDQASIQSQQDKHELIAAVSQSLPLAERHGVMIGFETSLTPKEFHDFLARFRHPLVRANYDTGNSASLGYDPVEEITTLDSFITNIHIKDRVLHGGTVPLGTGHANFPTIFSTLSKIRYQGPFILQTARDRDDVGVAVRYRNLVRSYVQEYLSGV